MIMEVGVSQRSVLGPVLWNIAFDSVLGLAENENKCEIVCYADDTLIVVTGEDTFRNTRTLFVERECLLQG